MVDTVIMTNKTALLIQVDRGAEFPELISDLFKFEFIQKVYLRDITSEFNADVFDFILYACDCVNERQLRWILPLAKRSPNSQFLILTDQISLHAYRQVASMENVITLQMPVDQNVVKSMIDQFKVLSSVKDSQRFPRFITNEPVRMVVMETGLLIPSTMKNYSVNGAYIEYKGIHLRVGHNLKVNLPKQENPLSKKPMQLDGRVVWVREANNNAGSSSGIGVQFSSW